jgi:uncharacterized membrane protein
VYGTSVRAADDPSAVASPTGYVATPEQETTPLTPTIDLGDHVMSEPEKTPQRHPVNVAREAQRAANIQLRVADAITTFAGSMPFVYLHAVLFALWMLFLESDPWPKLTLVVSLEAIFLSTFVMIGQNRQAAFQQAKADHEFEEQELELKTNTELTRAIHKLTTELHRRVIEEPSR